MILRPYPGTEAIHPVHLEAGAEWDGKRLHLSFRGQGPWKEYRGLKAGDSRGLWKDELWKTTCFECFLKTADSPTYLELNFASSGHWAVYHFEDYRRGMKPLRNLSSPEISIHFELRQFHFQANIDLSDTEFVNKDLLSSPSMVLEDQDRRITYWAGQHSQSKPDFHHFEQFILPLAAKGSV